MDCGMTPHFSFSELTQSDIAERYGIDNTPVDPHVVGNLYVLAGGLERCRSVLNKPMIVTSGYRCQLLNALVNGARSSAHLTGLAADFRVPGMTARAVCLLLQDHRHIGFDQLIHEGTWTHIAFPAERRPPRYSVLTAVYRADGPTTYTEGIT